MTNEKQGAMSERTCALYFDPADREPPRAKEEERAKAFQDFTVPDVDLGWPLRWFQRRQPKEEERA